MMGPPDLLGAARWFRVELVKESTKFSLVTHDGIQNQLPREMVAKESSILHIIFINDLNFKFGVLLQFGESFATSSGDKLLCNTNKSKRLQK